MISWKVFFDSLDAGDKYELPICIIIFTSVFLTFVVITYLNYFYYRGNRSLLHFHHISQLSNGIATLLVSCLPVILSQIAFIIICILACVLRNSKFMLEGYLNRGIISSNRRFQKKEEERFSRLFPEEKEQWLNEQKQRFYIITPIKTTLFITIFPYIIGNLIIILLAM